MRHLHPLLLARIHPIEKFPDVLLSHDLLILRELFQIFREVLLQIIITGNAIDQLDTIQGIDEIPVMALNDLLRFCLPLLLVQVDGILGIQQKCHILVLVHSQTLVAGAEFLAPIDLEIEV